MLNGAARVVLVRHAAPTPDPSMAPERWNLNEDGRRAASALVGQISTTTLAASTETKAIETIRLASGVAPDRVRCDDRFDEVRRPGEPFDEQYRERRLAWVRGELDERHQGWENPALATARFTDGVRELLASTDGPVVIGSHGMIITAWLVAMGQLASGPAAGQFWLRLGFPEIIAVRSGE